MRTTTILTEQLVESESDHCVRTAVEGLPIYFIWHMTEMSSEHPYPAQREPKNDLIFTRYAIR